LPELMRYRDICLEGMRQTT